MRSVTLQAAWPSTAFRLALAGFGAKAGLLPLHVWLPEAHPAAPSPVSALMSGVMLKTAIYGLLRVTFDLLQGQLWWWGVLALVLGLATALFGVLFATVQTDMKRLLAYSSIENIGVIVAGIGLAILFKSYDKTLLAAVALTAALYHALNHAFFKSLLFLATGSVLHSTKERSLGRLGGLIHRMPWVAWLALAGTLACAGLPPLNGFVSEWLLLQAFLFTPSLPQSFVNILVPLAAAALVRASYSPAIVIVVIVVVLLLTIQIVHRLYHGRLRKGPVWDCGFPAQTARMQDTAEGFGQPIRQIFEQFFRIERTLPTPFDAQPRYFVKADDHLWYWLYLPIARAADWAARLIGRIQQGRISVYLTFSFFTLLALLYFVR